MTAPPTPPRRPTPAADVAGRIPLLPAIAGALVLVGLIGALAGGCGGGLSAVGGYSTSRSELCSAYRTALNAFDDDSEFDVTDELTALADAAKDYDDSGVRSDGEDVDSSSGLISESGFRSDTRNIAAECG